MENTKINMPENPELTDREMLVEIYKTAEKTKNYMKWSLIITISLVVIPLLATLLVVPIALKSLSSVYTSGDLPTQESIQSLIK